MRCDCSCHKGESIIKHTTKRETLKVGQDFKERFFSKTTKADNGCVVWMGESHNLRLPNDAFTTPRRAAYAIKHGHLPTREIKLKCLTENCVAWQHFLEGRESKSGRRQELSEMERAKIVKAFKDGASKSRLARDFKVSVGTIFNVVK